MKWKWNLILFFVIVPNFYFTSGYSQAPFSRGINLTGWFQVNSPGQIQFTRFTKKDILNIKSLGCDVIRLPVNLHSMTLGSPSYTLDPVYLAFQDSVVKWCEQAQIYLIIDNHSFDPNINTSPDIADILIKVWSQLAARYKDRSEYILYEILNEPHGITTSVWGSIQDRVISAIRNKDGRHTIVVGGSGYNTYTELRNLPVYEDTNLLYTFHFYDPFMFTHQGATWVSPSMEPLSGVPFPYDAARMPACPPGLKGTWIESGLNSYSGDGTVSSVRQLIDNAINFRNSRKVNIFCGEFGVYMVNSSDDDRTYWYQVVREYLGENNIPWTTWDYKGAFGLFKKGSGELFDYDLNIPLIQSLGLNVPPQTPFTIRPDSDAIVLYSDFIGAGINDGSYGTGKVNFYSTDLPNNDTYCLKWSDFSQYNSLVFDFNPDRDLSRLLSGGYSVDFMLRGNSPGIKFDIRFIDTKNQNAGDHPWRMSATIDEPNSFWDKKWHHIHIPLTSFNESGSWDNNSWYTPGGQFDWTAIDRFEVSSEYLLAPGKELWFDNIIVTDRDTAVVRESGVLGIERTTWQDRAQLKVDPNPMNSYAKITYSLTEESTISVSIYSVTGNKIRNLLTVTQSPGDQCVTWDGCGDTGAPVPAGLYICALTSRGNIVTKKIIKY
jgi:endoglucanase